MCEFSIRIHVCEVFCVLCDYLFVYLLELVPTNSKGPAYILTTEDSSFLIKKILTPDDGRIGRNM
jgi:hypothetical protein